VHLKQSISSLPVVETFFFSKHPIAPPPLRNHLVCPLVVSKVVNFSWWHSYCYYLLHQIDTILEKKQFIKENNKTHSEWWISSLKPTSGLAGGGTHEWRSHEWVPQPDRPRVGFSGLIHHDELVLFISHTILNPNRLNKLHQKSDFL